MRLGSLRSLPPLLLLLGACGRLGFANVDRDAVDGGSDASASSYAAVVLGDQPRVYYHLDELGGPVARDATGHGNNTQYFVDRGAFAWGLPGALRDGSGTAVQIDGDGNIGPNVSAELPIEGIGIAWGADFTVELFIRPLAPAGGTYDNVLVICEDYLVNGFRTGWRDDLELELWTVESGGTTNLIGVGPLALGAWNHVVIVMRGTTAEIWRDAVLVASGPVGYVPANAQSECGFGALHGLPTHGVFDELAIYERALSPAQIAAHFAAR